MKVFMSWSGRRSKLTAELLHDWIKCVIQAAQPWISSKGIERGALWFSEINNELKDTAVGIICLTQENKNAPWILFEAGALAKGLSTNRVCTFLIDLEAQDLQPPLAEFNHTFSNKESLWSLMTTLNNGLEVNRLDLPVLQRVFETYWPQFETGFSEILANNPPNTIVAPREEKDILAEILETTRSMSNRIRTLEDRNKIPAALAGRSITHTIVTPGRYAGGGGGAATGGGGGGGLIGHYTETIEKDLHALALAVARSHLRAGESVDAVTHRLMAEHKIPFTLARQVIDEAIEVDGDNDNRPN